MSNSYFRFKQFTIRQADTAMKVNTDGVLLGAWADTQHASRVLDVGTGTGVIALMMAQRNSSALIDAIDVDAMSVKQANENIGRSAWTDRINVVCESFQLFAPKHRSSYDLVISNPPYFVGALQSLDVLRTITRHAEQLPHGSLIENSLQVLKSNGRLCVVLPYTEGTMFIAAAKEKGLYCVRKTNVLTMESKLIKRLLLTFTREVGILHENSLCIHLPCGTTYTEEYKQLTRDFYLKF